MVRAETSKNKVPIATTLSGCLIGVLAGPLGIIIGIGIGAVSGGAVFYNDHQEVENFNNNVI